MQTPLITGPASSSGKVGAVLVRSRRRYLAGRILVGIPYQVVGLTHGGTILSIADNQCQCKAALLARLFVFGKSEKERSWSAHQEHLAFSALRRKVVRANVIVCLLEYSISGSFFHAIQDPRLTRLSPSQNVSESNGTADNSNGSNRVLQSLFINVQAQKSGLVGAKKGVCFVANRPVKAIEVISHAPANVA